MAYATSPGRPTPLGATVNATGVNFSLFSEHAERVELLLFDRPDATAPAQVVPLAHPTLFYWHVQVEGLGANGAYAYRVYGPSTPADTSRYGHRFDASKVLIDPYARGNLKTLWVASASTSPGDNVASSMRSIILTDAYDWEGDASPNRPLSETVIYELHVRGFTRSPTSGVEHPGTFAGLVEKLPYIAGLGVTAIELMPVFDFDEKTIKRFSPTTGQPLTNYWGYDPISFFAPQASYCISPDAAGHVRDFRDMVKAAHRLGLEVLLDVVYNHTGEGGSDGPVIDFKGIDNSDFYFLDAGDRSRYRTDLTGCENAVRCNHPFTAKMIADSLAFWVADMHVDGFRFDLGTVLTLGEDGRPLEYPPVVWALSLDPRFANTKVIVEPFGGDSADILGSFPDIRSATWNFRFKNAARRFVRGDGGLVGEIATRICGSSDLFDAQGFCPPSGVSYITCHDGFTLNDLVSYGVTHNQANGEISGETDNCSRNYGAEGPSADPAIESLRARQIRNFLCLLFLSQGVPMLLAGDECRRTQQGNNNPYLQDNAVSWFDWTLVERNAELVRLVQFLADFRRRHPALRRPTFFRGVPAQRGLLDVEFHGCLLRQPGFDDPSSAVLALTIADDGLGEDIHVIFNMEDTSLAFDLPPVTGRRWYRAVDTFLPGPETIAVPGAEVLITTPRYDAAAKSVVVLVSKT